MQLQQQLYQPSQRKNNFISFLSSTSLNITKKEEIRSLQNLDESNSSALLNNSLIDEPRFQEIDDYSQNLESPIKRLKKWKEQFHKIYERLNLDSQVDISTQANIDVQQQTIQNIDIAIDIMPPIQQAYQNNNLNIINQNNNGNFNFTMNPVENDSQRQLYTTTPENNQQHTAVPIQNNNIENLQKYINVNQVKKCIAVLEKLYLEKIIIISHIVARLALTFVLIYYVLTEQNVSVIIEYKFYLITLMSSLLLKEIGNLQLNIWFLCYCYNMHYNPMRQVLKQNNVDNNNSQYLFKGEICQVFDILGQTPSYCSTIAYRKKCLSGALLCYFLYKNEVKIGQKYFWLFVGILPIPAFLVVSVFFMFEFYIIQMIISPILVAFIVVYELRKQVSQEKLQQEQEGLVKNKACFLLTTDSNFPKNEVQDCSICMSEFEGNEKKGEIVQFPCYKTHIFHTSCAKQWYNQSNKKSCPICKRQFGARNFFGQYNEGVKEKDSRFQIYKKQCYELLSECLPHIISIFWKNVIMFIVIFSWL